MSSKAKTISVAGGAVVLILLLIVVESFITIDYDLKERHEHQYGLEKEVKDHVFQVINDYKTNPDVSALKLDVNKNHYVYVIDFETHTFIAHPQPSLIGKNIEPFFS